MMKWKLLAITLSFLIILFECKAIVVSDDVPRMTKEELKTVLGNPSLMIIDVRYGKDWTDSDLKIRGAIREEPDNVRSWVSKYSKEKTLILYCA